VVIAGSSKQRLQQVVARELDVLEQLLGKEARVALAAEYLRRGIRGTSIASADGAEISDRERVVLVHYALGRRMRDLARELGGLSIRTIETYLAEKKLGVHGREAVVRLAIARGWFGAPSG